MKKKQCTTGAHPGNDPKSDALTTMQRGGRHKITVPIGHTIRVSSIFVIVYTPIPHSPPNPTN